MPSPRRAPTIPVPVGVALAVALVVALGAGCRRRSHGGAGASRVEAPLPVLPWKGAAIAHGGAGSPASMSDGCRAAVDAALAALESGRDPVDAAVAGVVVMEDDPRFNAG